MRRIAPAPIASLPSAAAHVLLSLLGLLSLLSVLGMAACGGNDKTPADSAASGEPASSPGGDAPSAPASEAPHDPARLLPIGSAHPAAPGAGGLPAKIETPTVTFEIPAHWERVEPSSAMRLAQARIPGPAGSGDLAVFHFGAGQGGDVEANLQRWIEQVQREPGVEPRREVYVSAGIQATMIEVSGTLLPSSSGMGPAAEQPNSRLLGAVVEGPGGPWFFKATGPAATMANERDAFVALLLSVRPAGS